MLLSISDNFTVADVQDKFNECFPRLKIEFYWNAQHSKESSRGDEIVDSNRRIGDIRNKHDHGILEIKSWYQTGRVEHDLKVIFGLNAQVFRNENGRWRETVASNKLTLQEQQQLVFGH